MMNDTRKEKPDENKCNEKKTLSYQLGTRTVSTIMRRHKSNNFIEEKCLTGNGDIEKMRTHQNVKKSHKHSKR